MEDLLEAGNAYRTTESTKLNAVSSRSHAVLQLRVDTGGRQQGKLSLIDLAGSERANKTGVVAKVSAALVLGGVDCNGPSLYTVYPHGSTDSLPARIFPLSEVAPTSQVAPIALPARISRWQR